jgi:protein TonB
MTSIRVGLAFGGLAIVLVLGSGVPSVAQTPEWRRACNPAPFLLKAPGGGGRDSAPRTPEVTLAELDGLQPTVPVAIDRARCFYLMNDAAAALTSAVQALDLLRSEPIPAAATTPAARRPIAGLDVPVPAKTRNVLALYPTDYAEVGIAGIVFIDAVIDREGQVKSPSIAASIPALDEHVLDAVKQWRYAPTVVNGQPAEVAITFSIRFDPDGNSQAVSALDAARFFYARQRHADAEAWLSRAIDLFRSEDAEWRALSAGARRVGSPSPPPQGRVIATPAKIVDAFPVYPRLAKAARIQGLVVIEAIIGKDGNVHLPHIIRSAPMLDYAALSAVRRWKYMSATVDGEPTDVIMTITVTFNLD